MTVGLAFGDIAAIRDVLRGLDSCTTECMRTRLAVRVTLSSGEDQVSSRCLEVVLERLGERRIMSSLSLPVLLAVSMSRVSSFGSLFAGILRTRGLEDAFAAGLAGT